MDEATRKRYLQMPMPPSWEVKYDFSSRRYFYIDHNTKQTTWEDPRPDHYARLERQQQEQQQQQQQQQQRQQMQYRTAHSYMSSHAAASLGNRSSPATSPRRPETIALQQMAESPRSRPSSTRTRPGTSSQADAESDFLPLPTDQDFELAVLQSKFPNKPKEMLQAALKMSKGNVTLATMRIRQGDTSQDDAERELGGKCRSLCSDFPELNQEAVMGVLKENEGNMYRTRERLKKIRAEKAQQDSPQVSMAAKVRALAAKFNSIESNIIREMLEECNGDSAEVSRKLAIITSDAGASASPGSAARHPSPQPRSVMEGTNSLDRQQKHRMLVSELAAEFPAVERAVVRRTLASTGWKMAESRQKLKDTVGIASPAARATPSPRPATAQSSGSSGSGQSLPSAPQPVQKPKPVPGKGKERKHKSKKSKDSKKKHKTKEKQKAAPEVAAKEKVQERSSIAVGRNADLAKGPGSLAKGPDPALRSGPQAELAKGPAGLAAGRNSGLACGADPFLPKGSVTRSYQTVLVL